MKEEGVERGGGGGGGSEGRGCREGEEEEYRLYFMQDFKQRHVYFQSGVES